MSIDPAIQAVIAALGRKKRKRRLPKPRNNEIPKLLIAQYQKRLSIIVDLWKKATKEILFPHLANIEKQVGMERNQAVKDSWPDDLQAQLDILMKEYERLANQSHDLAAGTFDDVNGMSRKRWYEIAKAVMGVELLKHEPWIENEARAFLKENMTLIRKLSADTAHDINQILMNGFRSGRRIETMEKQILGTGLPPTAYRTEEGKLVFVSVERRARTIARDQTSKLWGNLNKMRQENIGLEIYQWRTVRDERVRPMHRALDMKYCKWSDPNVYADTLEDAMAGKWKERTSEMVKLHPGEDINCRCFSSPVFETFMAETKEEE
jgi:SPP1 gp7 family putative phage head morphogenesis protein